MDILVRGVPVQTTDSALKDFFTPVMKQFSIHVFHCRKFKNKPLAILTVTDIAKADSFLKKYSNTTSLASDKALLFFNTALQVSESRYKSDELILKTLRYEEGLLRKTDRSIATKPSKLQRTFDFSCLQCGIWDYDGSEIMFASQFQDTRRGSVVFGHRALAMILRTDHMNTSTTRIDIPYWSVDTILTCSQMNRVTFTLTLAPRVYKLGDDLERLMSDLGLGRQRRQKYNRTRVCAIDESHRSVIGSCFVYQISLANSEDASKLDQLVQRNRGMPPILGLSTPYTQAHGTFLRDLERLMEYLHTGHEFGGLTFSAKFQIERLARNAYLPPSKIVALFPVIERLSYQTGHIPTSMAIRMLSRYIESPGPHMDSGNFENDSLVEALARFAQEFKLEGSIYDVNSWKNQGALIHRVIITPAGTYLEGPEPEVSNRVLRQFPAHTDCFLRVEFMDEDGDLIRFEPKTNLSEIFNSRFKGVLDSAISIGGRSFEFLGFSHSSLRQKTCWFMSAFVQNDSLITAQDVIKGLGDFSTIRSPARCAARIGQAFSDTTAAVTVSPEAVRAAHDVVRNGHTFSDGVGTISDALLRRVWKQYERGQGLRPTCLQIRFAGAKGVVSLDNRLQGEQLVLRQSMVKFYGSKAWDIELCGANFRPLPLYLNRQLIKILEDLGVPAHGFLELQNTMVEQIRRITESPINAATFLESARVGLASRMPFLFRMLEELGLSFDGDKFLSDVVEIAALSQLRDLKYRSRIHVEKGVTLYGIMDETGVLEEGEIYCVMERPGDNGRSKRTVLSGGDVIVTRSPAMHPGDVQKARAVSVPADSPLQALSNVVVFSRNGQRDLPSQLSGGDLDGDLYNVIFDKRLMPQVTHIAAEYRNIPPLDIGRPVTRKDITDFFIKFMEADQLGRISMVHMQLADRRPNGTLDPDCKKLAEMASTAVDFSKTGIPVDMSQCPRYDMIRPDFMAGSPHVTVERNGVNFPKIQDDATDGDDAVGALDPDFKTFNYYESERVLGRLYRAIDEKRIFQEMHQNAQTVNKTLGGLGLIEQVWEYVLRETALIQWEAYKPLAREVREIYESNLLDIMSDYSTHPRYPLSEIEVFGGNIVGKNSGNTNRRIRERTTEMNQRFERDVTFIIQRIKQGDDGDRDEALARSIACLAVGMSEQRRPNNRIGAPRSWKYVAAAVCLREVELFKMKYDPFNSI